MLSATNLQFPPDASVKVKPSSEEPIETKAAAISDNGKDVVNGGFGDAVIVSVQNDYLSGQSQNGAANLISLTGPEGAEQAEADFFRKVDVESALSSIRINSEIVKREEERISFLENVEPAPARVLEGEEAEKTLKMLEAFKNGDVLMGVSEAGRRSWEVDNLLYALQPDGTLTVNEAGVPTSEEERQSLLNASKERLAPSQEGLVRAQETLAALLSDGLEIIA